MENGQDGRDERRGAVIAIALVVAMAAGVFVLGVTDAFPGGRSNCPGASDHPTLTIEVARGFSATRPPATAYRLATPELSDADVAALAARSASSLRFAPPPTGGAPQSADDATSLRVARTPIGWSFDVQPGLAFAGSFVGESLHRGARPVARRVAIEALGAFGVDSSTWTIEIDPIPEPDVPERYVTLTPSVDGVPVEALQWEVTVDTDGSVGSMSGVRADIVPAARLTPLSPQRVLRAVGARHDEFRTEEIDIGVDVSGREAPTVEPFRRTLRANGLRGTRNQCIGWFGYTPVAAAILFEGVLLADPPTPPGFTQSFTFRPARAEPALAFVLPAGAEHAFLVHAYRFTGPIDLPGEDQAVRGQTKLGSSFTELAVPRDELRRALTG